MISQRELLEQLMEVAESYQATLEKKLRSKLLEREIRIS